MDRTFADFFAGIGLVRVGLETQGWRSLWANDIDPAKFTMYSAYFGPDHYRLDDIRNVQPDDVPDVDLAHASFPCVDLSLAGERAGLNGRESGLVWEFIRILRGMAQQGRAPQLVTLENVLGWITSRGGHDFRAVIETLNSLGYVCDAVVLDAAWFVPQSRPRVFVIGRLGGHPLMSLHPFDVEPSRVRPSKLVEFMRTHVDLAWGLISFPDPPRLGISLEDILEDLPEDHEAWWPEDRAAYLLSQMKPQHLSLVRAAAKRDDLLTMTVYRRMRHGRSMAEVRADGVAGCLRTPRGGSSRQILVIAGRGRIRVRLMTAREYARLQGVPDTYPIDVPYNQALWGFGDGVCVPVVEWLAEHALNRLVAPKSASLVAACR